ncbi:unnamed protein product, partial [Vitis vinifera]
MAKPRKPKTDDNTKPENSNSRAVVRHQKLCLSIDIDKRRIYGYTELEIAVPDIGIVGLHAENLVIESVSVDGEPTEFEFYPHHQHTESEKRWSSVLSASSAADVASSMYVSALERELDPNLLIMCCKPEKSASEQQGQQSLENGLHSSGEPKQHQDALNLQLNYQLKIHPMLLRESSDFHVISGCIGSYKENAFCGGFLYQLIIIELTRMVVEFKTIIFGAGDTRSFSNWSIFGFMANIFETSQLLNDFTRQMVSKKCKERYFYRKRLSKANLDSCKDSNLKEAREGMGLVTVKPVEKAGKLFKLVQNVKLVRVDYWVERAETGIHFEDNVLHTDNQIRRARCWFPCMDDTSQCCCYDLEFTVAHNLVAVSTGSLLYQVLSKDDPPRKTYVYKLNVPVTARWIQLAVAPFEVLPDRHSGLLSYLCLPANLPKLWNTVGFFHSAFSHYEDYLSASFPFGSYKQVFIAPEMAISSLTLGASMSIFSSQILFDEKVIDQQTIDTRIKLAYALARQWFGVFISPEAPNDEWLLDGLAGFLTDSFVKRFLGNNEARYRRYKVCFLMGAFTFGLPYISCLLIDLYNISEFNHITKCNFGCSLNKPFPLIVFAQTKLLVRLSLFGYSLQANCAVCKADDSGATALSSSASCKDLYGTQCIGLYGKIRSWKSVAILQMLEKQMGPESFRKILQTIVFRAQDTTRSLRTLSTKEFRHFANKVGNLERPFLKEFFPRWVGSCGCPVLRAGLSYNKRKNLVELAVLRGCTAAPDTNTMVLNGNIDSENREVDIGWPGMMSIRVHELDGMYDHPILPMAGETWQLLEIQCHSKLAARRFQKPKKGSKPDGSDDNGDVPAVDMRSNTESPLLWLRVDPELEYLAEIHFNQPAQMWINQLERDKDVVAQAQAIATLEALPQLSFSVVNALNNFLSDSKAFWRVRIEAAFALANTASEETDWAGLLHLVKFYKSRRFDANIGLPKPNDFHDFPEYFVLEAIPHAIAMVRAADKKSPREAVEFVLQLLKYNDNNGNPYSDVFWLAALVQSVGELEFGQQSILFLSSLLKRIDRLLQFDRLMPSYNGILTISCIRTLTQIGLKLSGFIPLDRVIELVKPFRDFQAIWQVRIEASRALLGLEFHFKGIDAALSLFIKYVEEEPSIRGQVKLGVHAMRLCQIKGGSESDNDIKSSTLVALLRLLESRIAFNNVFLRHHLFCILRILAGRLPTLYGVPRDQIPQMDPAEIWKLILFPTAMNGKCQ